MRPSARQRDLSPHLLAGGFERSEVVTDGAKQDSARTSFGSWLSGHKRSNKVEEGGRDSGMSRMAASCAGLLACR